jgi:ABC-type glycerol-3-phosphate transport system substrate-binding protein
MKKFSRREFLRMSALAAAGVAATGLKPAKLTAAPPAEAVTLDCMSLAEYEGPYREIWNVFEATHEGIKINTFSINEDTAAAHEAKVAGGYLPAIELTQEMQIFFNKDNYQMAVDLSSFDFPWWDRFTFDAKNAWANLYGLPGPRSLDPFQGYVFTWQYNGDLMDQAGLDPQRDVKSWEDMEKWIEEGTKWAASEPDVDYFWNQAWHNWGFWHFVEVWPLAWQDGSRQRQADCFLGKAKFNAEDSPVRHSYEWYKKANDNGWIPEKMWTRLWEGDMEASYIAGKSVMMMHGPWVWDKALAAGSTFDQRGLPSTPPADGGTWLQYAAPPNIDNQWFMRAEVQELPEWPQIMEAWNWFFSPEAIPMRSQAEGRVPLYNLDEPLDLQGPQYQAVLKEIGTEGGKWAEAKFEEGLTGTILAGPYRKKGSKGVWDWEANGNNVVFADLLSGKITVQEALDIAQRNWEESYEGLPLEG